MHLNNNNIEKYKYQIYEIILVLNSVNIITIKINSFTKNINYSNTDNTLCTNGYYKNKNITPNINNCTNLSNVHMYR